MKLGFSAEPAAWIGLLATVIVGVLTQVVGSGLITSAGSLDVLNTLITIIPIVAGLVIRNFVSPTPTPPAIPATVPPAS